MFCEKLQRQKFYQNRKKRQFFDVSKKKLFVDKVICPILRVMTEKGSPLIAIVVTKQELCGDFFNHVKAMIDQGKVLSPNIEIRIFVGLDEFANSLINIQTLQGCVFDQEIASSKDENHKRVLKILEDVKLPILSINSSNIFQGAVEKKILNNQWKQFEEALSRYSPRGMRSHPRKIAYIKVLLMKTPTIPDRMLRCVTFDISLGGCFIVSMDDWNSSEILFLSFGDSKGFIESKICWRLPWGKSEWHLPGIGVKFINPSDDRLVDVKKYLEL